MKIHFLGCFSTKSSFYHGIDGIVVINNLAENKSECDSSGQRIKEANIFCEAKRAGRINTEEERPHGKI